MYTDISPHYTSIHQQVSLVRINSRPVRVTETERYTHIFPHYIRSHQRVSQVHVNSQPVDVSNRNKGSQASTHTVQASINESRKFAQILGQCVSNRGSKIHSHLLTLHRHPSTSLASSHKFSASV